MGCTGLQLGLSTKKIALVAVGVLTILVVLVAPRPEMFTVNSVVADPDVDLGYPNPYWSQSTWTRGVATYDYVDVDGGVSMSTRGVGFGGVGLFQGKKPFDWSESQNVFSRVLVEEDLMVYWRGKIDRFLPLGLQSQVNLGVDFWFEVEHEGVTKVGEVFLFFYQQGLGSMPVDSQLLRVRSEPDTSSWQYLMYHVSQIGFGKVSLETFDLADAVSWFRSASVDPVYMHGDYWLIGVDCHLEVLDAEASYTLDYCAVGYPAE